MFRDKPHNAFQRLEHGESGVPGTYLACTIWDLERISDLSNGAEAYEDTCAKKPDLFPTLTSHSKIPKHSNQNRRNEARDRPFDNTPPAKFTH